MNLHVLVLESGNTLTLGEKFSLAGEMVIRGMGTVFIVLMILWATIAVFGAVSKASAKKSKSAAPSVPAPAPDVSASAGNNAELTAAIIAAIEAYRAGEGLGGRAYRVVSFKKRDVRSRRGSDD